MPWSQNRCRLTLAQRPLFNRAVESVFEQRGVRGVLLVPLDRDDERVRVPRRLERGLVGAGIVPVVRVGERRVLRADTGTAGAFQHVSELVEASERAGSSDAESDEDVSARNNRAVTVVVGPAVSCHRELNPVPCAFAVGESGWPNEAWIRLDALSEYFEHLPVTVVSPHLYL